MHEFLEKNGCVLVFKWRDFIILPWYVSPLLPEIPAWILTKNLKGDNVGYWANYDMLLKVKSVRLDYVKLNFIFHFFFSAIFVYINPF